MNGRKILCVSISTLLLSLAVTSTLVVALGERPVVKLPEDLVWMERPSGVRVAVLQGDPEKPGPFTLRLQYPAGYRKGPHFHPRNAYVTVLSGSYFRGYGATVDEANAFELTPGTFSVNPGRISHYEWTVVPAELQVHATGPWETVYVDAEGSPLKGKRETGMPH